MVKTWWVLAVSLVFPASTALGSVTYTGEVPPPIPYGFQHLLATVQTPLSPADPKYVPGVDPVEITVNDFSFSQFSGANIRPVSPYGLAYSFPPVVKLNRSSLVAFGGPPGGDPTMYIYSDALLELITFDFTTQSVVPPTPSLNFINNGASSIAISQSGQLTMIADNLGYLVDTKTGADTLIFSETGGTAPGQFSNALYQCYGPDGLLYVLDYGNGRVQVLDPANNFAPVSQFNLNAGVVTANMQFAISNAGTLYFGDGTGGGSSYASDGTYLGSFSSPVFTPGALGQSYVSADGKGDVFVFDTTGAHQFADTPEPSTMSMLLLGIAAIVYRKSRP